MKEKILKDFFIGAIAGEELNAEAQTIAHRTSSDVTEHRTHPMAENFVVTRQHLVQLCESALSGDISVENLSALCLVLELSEQFQWSTDGTDAEIIADVANWCASPEINYPLTNDNIRLFVEYLKTGNDPFTE